MSPMKLKMLALLMTEYAGQSDEGADKLNRERMAQAMRLEYQRETGERPMKPLPFDLHALADVVRAATVNDDQFDNTDIEELRWEFGARVRTLHADIQRYNASGDLEQLALAKDCAAAVGAVALLMSTAFDEEAEAVRVLSNGGITAQEVGS